jgi:hypothetical protein
MSDFDSRSLVDLWGVNEAFTAAAWWYQPPPPFEEGSTWMTRQGAIDTGRNAAVTFGKPFVVYRLPKWPEEVYGVIACDRLLPMEAQRFEELGGVPVPPPPQGSLFD